MEERPILITGGSGFLGGHLVSAFADRYATYYTFFSHPVQALTGARGVHADITDYSTMSEVIKPINPRLILHTAAIANFNQCAANPYQAYKVNVQGTENISKVAKELDARFINFSTDMVFDGTKLFSTENDTPFPCCTYGKTKFEAEQITAGILKDFLNIRLSTVYGLSLTNSKCHAEKVVNKLLLGEKALTFSNEFRTPIFVEDIVDILLELAMRNDVKGILHLAGPDRLSRHEFGLIMAIFLCLPEDCLVASDDNSRFLEPRPKDCSLKSLRLSNLWHGRMTAPDIGIADMVQKINRTDTQIKL